MLVRIVLVLLLAAPGTVLADASSGEFMGYQLGKPYQPTANTQQRRSTTGNLLIQAEEPVKPDDIATVTILATPETRAIGSISASQWFATEEEARAMGRKYFELLQAKYPDWPYGWEVMDAEFNIVEVSFNSSPHNLRLNLVEDQHDGKAMWRFSMTLGWLPGSDEDTAWRDLSVAELATVTTDRTQQLLKESDTRGL